MRGYEGQIWMLGSSQQGDGMTKWRGLRLAHAKEKQQRKKKRLTQHFLEFKAQSWNGKSKHIHVRQTSPIHHQAGQTGHTVSIWGLSSLHFLPCVCPDYHSSASIYGRTESPHLQKLPALNSKRGNGLNSDQNTKFFNQSKEIWFNWYPVITIVLVQNDSLLCLSVK